jgi:alkanesulfonate monooxygenase SsuD/methylene tetrahydromethanopterin reductase-like flavin-dependent oxidoreductase (luciferase family)
MLPGATRPRLQGRAWRSAASADRDPEDVRRIRQILVSYGDDYDEALESTGFWRGVPAVGFDQEIPDPRDIEEAGREMSVEEMTDTWIVTTDPADVREEIEASRAAGFDEVEIHSASPDQAAFVDAMAENVLPKF